MGREPARRVPAGRRRDDRDASSGSSRSASRACRSRTGSSTAAGDDRPRDLRLARRTREAFCARDGVRLPSEEEWEAAARGGDDRLWPWGDELPDRSRAEFGSGIGGPVPVGSFPAGASPCGALDMAGNVFEWTSGAASRAAAPSSTGRTTCAARRASRCTRRRATPTSASASSPSTAAPGFDWVDVPAGEYPIGASTGGEHDVVDLPAFELGRTPVTNAQYAAFVEETGAEPPPHWPAPARPSGHVRRLVRGVGVLRVGRRAAADRGRVGEGARAAPTGGASRGATRRTPSRAAIGAGSKHGATVAGRRASGGREPLRSAGHGGQRLGVDGERRMRDGERCCAAGRSRARASRGRAARCAAAAGPSGARRTSASGWRDERRRPTGCASARSRSCQVASPTGDTAEVARLYADWCEELGMDVEFLDDVFPATPTVVARLRRRRPGPSRRPLRAPRRRADPARAGPDRRRPDLRTRRGRHEGRCVLRARGGPRARRVRAVRRRARARADRPARGARAGAARISPTS